MSWRAPDGRWTQAEHPLRLAVVDVGERHRGSMEMCAMRRLG